MSRPHSRASSMALPYARSGGSGAATAPAARFSSLTKPNGSPWEATLYILGWYTFSLSISIYNKWMFGKGLDFHFPILITSFHQLCLFVLSSTVLYFRPRLRPDVDTSTSVANLASVDPLGAAAAAATSASSSDPLGAPGAPPHASHPSSSSSSSSSPSSPSTAAPAFPFSAGAGSSRSAFARFAYSCRMPLAIYVRSILPCSIASAGDIGLSNVSFKFISLTLYTMLKTSSLGFVLIFGLLFGLEKFRWNLILIVATMSFSVLLMVNKSGSPAADAAVRDESSQHDSSSVGIVLVLGASMMSGLRWSFTQILLKSNDYTSNSISTIFFLSPAMCGILFVMGLLFEGWAAFTSSPIWELKGVLGTIVLMIIPGILAFMMTLCEFKLLTVAQVITLSIAGIFKELLTILLSALIFGDRLSWINCVGLVLTFLDIVWYNYYRYSQKVAPGGTAGSVSSSSSGISSSTAEYSKLPKEADADIELKAM